MTEQSFCHIESALLQIRSILTGKVNLRFFTHSISSPSSHLKGPWDSFIKSKKKKKKKKGKKLTHTQGRVTDGALKQHHISRHAWTIRL